LRQRVSKVLDIIYKCHNQLAAQFCVLILHNC
jgi:hypothetical protein